MGGTSESLDLDDPLGPDPEIDLEFLALRDEGCDGCEGMCEGCEF